MEDILASPIFWAAFALVSELVGASKLRQNGIIAVVFDTIKKMKPKTTDTDK